MNQMKMGVVIEVSSRLRHIVDIKNVTVVHRLIFSPILTQHFPFPTGMDCFLTAEF
jgi:hypothetical protein